MLFGVVWVFRLLYEGVVVTEFATQVERVFVAVHQPIQRSIIVVSHFMEVATKFITLAFVIRLQDSYQLQLARTQ
jgi:hypothetical protein